MSYGDLMGLAWTVAIAAAAFWWTLFSSLRADHQANLQAEIRSRLQKIAGECTQGRKEREAIEKTIEKWMRTLEDVGLAFFVPPFSDEYLSARRWFLGGLLSVSHLLLLPSLTMDALPEPSVDHAAIESLGKLMCIISILASLGIILVSLWIGIRFDAMRAFLRMARPGRRPK